jgi:hypothetical protein
VERQPLGLLFFLSAPINNASVPLIALHGTGDSATVTGQVINHPETTVK